jgi:hypothetical protein
MKHRSFIPLKSLMVAVVLVVVPRGATSGEPMLPGLFGLDEEGSLQLREDGYGNAKCDGRCGAKPCCSGNIYQA